MGASAESDPSLRVKELWGMNQPLQSFDDEESHIVAGSIGIQETDR